MVHHLFTVLFQLDKTNLSKKSSKNKQKIEKNTKNYSNIQYSFEKIINIFAIFCDFFYYFDTPIDKNLQKYKKNREIEKLFGTF